ncbi:MAG: Fe-S cluster assembly protein SufD [Bacteroidetes bacterium]|nr:Fe-S cluster assembly protein SufD [Bacteroidota bacterium]
MPEGNISKTTVSLEDRILTRHAAFMANLNGSQPFLLGLRSNALQAFQSLGFPGRKSEDWKYTPVTKWLDASLQMAESHDEPVLAVPPVLKQDNRYLAVSVNGIFRADLSELPGAEQNVVVCSLADAFKDHTELVQSHIAKQADYTSEAFTALNTAFLGNGLFVWIPDGASLDYPLYVTDICTDPNRSLIQPRNLFVVGANATGTILEWYDGPGHPSCFENAVTEFYVGPSSRVNHIYVFDRGESADLINSLFVYQEKDSYFATNHLTLSGRLVRYNLNFLPDGEGCETHLLGLVLARNEMHVDVHTFVDHAKPNSISNELYKCILDGNSVGVFNGKIMVRQDAQLINAYQSNRSVLLSDSAHMYSKPELEIYADDVKCSHGATTGQLDEEAIFYLRSRGLRQEEARLLLLESFAREVIEQVDDEAIRAYLGVRLRELLGEPAVSSTT